MDCCNEKKAFVTGGDKRGSFRYKRNFERSVLKTPKFAVLIASYCHPFIPTALANQVIIKIKKGMGCYGHVGDKKRKAGTVDVR
jgi:hypothetical protein